jgi:hypothetical protein
MLKPLGGGGNVCRASSLKRTTNKTFITLKFSSL